MTDLTLNTIGGIGGQTFTDYQLPTDARLKEVHIFSNQYIDALQLGYVDPDGKLNYLPRVGGEGGDHAVFTLDDDEYLTGISGVTGWYVDDLQFHTNKRQSPTFGGPEGEDNFEYRCPDGKEIVGFYGRVGQYLDAVGVITRELNGNGQTTREPNPKALQKIEGIGPKIASILIEAGIPDLQVLAQTPVEQLTEILAAAGPRYALAKPATWAEQAALGVKGDWKTLKILQDELIGGRRV